MSFSITEAAKFLDVRKVPAQLWLAVGLAAGFGLFAPTSVAARLGVEALRSAYRPYLGAALILSTAVLLSKGLTFGGRFVKEGVSRRRGTEQLRHLAPDQKGVLREYIDRDTCTLTFPLSDGVAQGLERMGLIYRASRLGVMERSSSFGSLMLSFPYNIRPWVREYLKKHPELMEDVESNTAYGPERR